MSFRCWRVIASPHLTAGSARSGNPLRILSIHVSILSVCLLPALLGASPKETVPLKHQGVSHPKS